MITVHIRGKKLGAQAARLHDAGKLPALPALLSLASEQLLRLVEMQSLRTREKHVV